MRLAGPFDRPLLEASPRGQVLVYGDGEQALVFDTRSLRATRIQRYGPVLAYSPDEQVLVFNRRGAFADADGVDTFELRVATGEVRHLARISRSWVLEKALALETTSGQVLAYDLATGAPRTIGTAFQRLGGERLLALDGTAVVLWDSQSGEVHRTHGPAVAAALSANGRAVVYQDVAGEAYGWAPPNPPVALGRIIRLDVVFVEGTSGAGHLVIRGAAGRALGWNLATNAVVELGPGIRWVTPASPTGHVVVVRAAGDTERLDVIDLATGKVTSLASSAPGSFRDPALSSDATRVAASFGTENGDSYRARLWDARTGAELPLDPAPPASSDGTWTQFVANERLLQVFVGDVEDALYALDGTRLFSTARTIIASEVLPVHRYQWTDDVFIMPTGSHELWAWDEALAAWALATRREVELGRSTRIACTQGDRVVYRHDLHFSHEYGTLSHWRPELEASIVVSQRAADVQCLAGDAAVFIEDETGAAVLPRGSVVYAAFGSGCRQVLARDIDRVFVHADSVVVSGPAGVERVTLPR